MLRRERYRRNKGRVDPIMLDIKLRYVGPTKPTRKMIVDAMMHMLQTGGQVPPQFMFAAIDWHHPNRANKGWQTGTVTDFDTFAPIIREKLSTMKIAVDRGAK